MTPPKHKELFKICIGSIFWAMILSAHGQNLQIDDFLSSGGTEFIEVAPGITDMRLIPNVGTLGGSRLVTLENTGNLLGTNYISFSDKMLNPSVGSFGSGLSTDTGSAAIWSFEYNANGLGLNVNLESLIAVELQMYIENINPEDEIFLTLVDNVNMSRTEEFLFPSNQPNFQDRLTARWNLSDFSSGSGGVDLSNIHTIRLSGTTSRMQDMAFDGFNVVPEPSSSFLLALSAGLFCFRRKRPNA